MMMHVKLIKKIKIKTKMPKSYFYDHNDPFILCKATMKMHGR